MTKTEKEISYLIDEIKDLLSEDAYNKEDIWGGIAFNGDNDQEIEKRIKKFAEKCYPKKPEN